MKKILLLICIIFQNEIFALTKVIGSWELNLRDDNNTKLVKINNFSTNEIGNKLNLEIMCAKNDIFKMNNVVVFLLKNSNIGKDQNNSYLKYKVDKDSKNFIKVISNNKDDDMLVVNDNKNFLHHIKNSKYLNINLSINGDSKNFIFNLDGTKEAIKSLNKLCG